MKFIGKLLLYVLIALAVAILGLYFLLQTRWGAEHVSAWVSQNSSYHLAFDAIDHRFSSPSHILLENVTFGRDGQPATLVAAAARGGQGIVDKRVGRGACVVAHLDGREGHVERQVDARVVIANNLSGEVPEDSLQLLAGLVVDAAESVSLRLTPPELASSPAAFRRPDGTSVFRPKHSAVFSSEVLLAAEDRLLERARTTTGPTVPLATVERITARPDREGRTLGPDQADALARIALSGRMIDVLVGPAGAGKTTAMNALRRAWEHEHGRGSVVGLAPSAVAAHVLADDLGTAAENTAKWLDTHDRTGATFRRGQLVVVDEASMAGTLALDRITALATEAGAKVLLAASPALA